MRNILDRQREAFTAELPVSLAVRKDRLKRAAAMVADNGARFCDALSEDFGHRSREQSMLTDIAASVGTDVPTYVLDRPGLSAFALEDGVVYHTYSSYARGLDGIWNMYQWLDRAPLGRNETGVWWRRHDEYDQR